jgi:hypothetical protein
MLRLLLSEGTELAPRFLTLSCEPSHTSGGLGVFLPENLARRLRAFFYYTLATSGNRLHGM